MFRTGGYHYVCNANHTNYNKRARNDDEDEDKDIPDFSNLIQGKKQVYRDNNHIYFKTEVTSDSVNKLCNLIDEYNREQDSFRSNVTTAIIIPKPIYLHITSLGGDLIAGFLAYDYVKNSKIPIHTVAEGYVMSSGASIFMGGTKRFMTENSYLLIHQLNMPKNGTETFHNMIDNTTNIIELMNRLYSIYLNNVKPRSNSDTFTKEKLENHMLHDIYWNYEICYKYGLVDALYTNYTNVELEDINELIGNSSTAETRTVKIKYSGSDLNPSSKIIEKIQENLNQNKQNVIDILKLIKNSNDESSVNKNDTIVTQHIVKQNKNELSESASAPTQVKKRKTRK